MSDVSTYIDEHFRDTVERLKRWCRQPSVSTEGRGVREMAGLAERELQEYGYTVDLYETEGFPIIVASLGPEDAPTILIYDHYDVQPEGDLSLWNSPPFEPEERDGKLYGRGVADTKGNVVARLDAIEAVRRVNGDLPVRIVWLLEGEEEIGSPNLNAFMAEHRAELRADGCIWEFGGYTWDGTPKIYLGLKGMLTVDLVARGPSRDIHSGQAAYVQSPVWRLLWALSEIKSPDGHIRIPGFYDRVKQPTQGQLALLEQIPDESREELESIGLRAYLNGMTGVAVHHASSFDPTFNIQGIIAGYNGEGSKTILPAEARAKADIRLVPDQDPEEIFQALRGFLQERGYSDIEVKRVAHEGDLDPSISDPDTPFIRNVRRACVEVSGREPVLVPSSSGSGPGAPFMREEPVGLGLPTAAFGVGYPDTRAHAPDENIRLSDMKAHMLTVARLIELMGAER
jgi:acetylornithine deacetylase/succinyl-diaminopimelate desuccinylase-like protein